MEQLKASRRTIMTVRKLFEVLLENGPLSVQELSDISNSSETTIREYIRQGYLAFNEISDVVPGTMPVFDEATVTTGTGVVSSVSYDTVKAVRRPGSTKDNNTGNAVVENLEQLNETLLLMLNVITETAAETGEINAAPVGSKPKVQTKTVTKTVIKEPLPELADIRKVLLKRLHTAKQWPIVETELNTALSKTRYSTPLGKLLVYMNLEYQLSKLIDQVIAEYESSYTV